MSTIYYALLNAYPSSHPPFKIELGVDNKKIIIDDCQHIPDSIEKLKKHCEENNIEFSQNFTLIYPIYLEIMDTDHEATMHNIAWLIKDEADENKWNFDRIGGLTGKTTEDFIE